MNEKANSPQLEFDPDRVCSNGLTPAQNMAEFRKAYDPARLGEPIPGALQMDATGRLLVVCPCCLEKAVLQPDEERGTWLTLPTFDFGTALRMLKAGKHVARADWLPGEYLFMRDGKLWLHEPQTAAKFEAEMAILGVTNVAVLADDWTVVP